MKENNEKKDGYRLSAVGVVEIVLILVVLVALVLIFRDNITALVTTAF